MILLYTIYFLCSVYLVYFIIKKPKEVIKQSLGIGMPPMIVEKAYRGVDYRTSVKIVNPLDRPINYDWRNDRNDYIPCTGNDRKERIIKDQLFALTEQMFKDNVIEVKEISGKEDYTLPPWETQIDLRLKVYKPE